MNLQDRVNLYNKAYPKYPKLWYDKNHMYGIWMIGNFYKNKSRLYGAYPHSYLDRMLCMFPDQQRILHLFSGSLNPDELNIPINEHIHWGFDLDQNVPEQDRLIIGDVKGLSGYFPAGKFNIVMSDPPYGKEHAKKYGHPMVNRRLVVRECYKVLKPGGFLIWLDVVYPMFRKDMFRLVGEIGVIRSTNHRVRMVFIFERREWIIMKKNREDDLNDRR